MINLDRRSIQNFDWLTFALVLLMSLVGIMTIYSTTRPIGNEGVSLFYLKQSVWLAIAILALLVCVAFDYNWLLRISTHLYVIGLVALVLVLIIGTTGMGAKRWISMGPLNFQPSEFFRVIFIISIASYLSKMKGLIDFMDIVKAMALFLLIPFALIIKEPDLGSAMILFFIFVAVVFMRGVHKKALVIIIVVGLISGPFMGKIVWGQLKDYQKNRLIAFVKPEVDPSGIGYQIDQSKITIGSGRFFGKGYMKGTQGPFRFLPEKHTDFIFAVFAEEWGFLGCALILAAYLTLLMRGLDTAVKAKDTFGRLTAFSIVIMFLIYFVINVGMTVGMMPVVGVPLPFMSYGGTSLVANFAATGILINIRMRRFALFY
ncbi:MAG: rod shape-determining protein RodA [Nitrospirota bacterium]|nr:MAG: rod shape-determining protein RodA [Nitrospirota bacterium]